MRKEKAARILSGVLKNSYHDILRLMNLNEILDKYINNNGMMIIIIYINPPNSNKKEFAP